MSAPVGGPVTSLSVVIPVYGDGACLPELLGRLGPVLSREAGEEWEVILVNDGSPGETWTVIARLAASEPRVRGLNLQRNFGQHNALLAGLQISTGERIVTIDDDLQHPPEEIPRVLAALGPGIDLVYGTAAELPHGLFRNATSVVGKAVLATVLGAPMARQISAFRAIRGGLRNVFRDYRSPYVSIDVLLSWATTRITSTEVRHEPRAHGRSQYTLRRLARHWMNMVTGFSVWPLRVASLVGLAFLGFGFLVLAWVIGRYLVLGGSVPGFPFLACIIVLFSGAQLFALGVIGEYLSRLYFRMLDRPPYLVATAVNLPAGAPRLAGTEPGADPGGDVFPR